MGIAQAARRVFQALIWPSLFATLTLYFAWNATRGEHGLRTYRLRQAQLVTAQQEQKTAEAERDAWEVRVAGLRQDHIDPDALDERARAMLNLADPADIVVPLPAAPPQAGAKPAAAPPPAHGSATEPR